RTAVATLELSTFNGDEPSSPYAAPRWRRFGDSWSARLTATPLRAVEVQASAASVRAPENPDGGGLDQVKWSSSARWQSGQPLGTSGSASDARYALVEWARTDWTRNGSRVRVPGYRDGSALAEG